MYDKREYKIEKELACDHYPNAVLLLIQTAALGQRSGGGGYKAQQLAHIWRVQGLLIVTQTKCSGRARVEHVAKPIVQFGSNATPRVLAVPNFTLTCSSCCFQLPQASLLFHLHSQPCHDAVHTTGTHPNQRCYRE